MKLWRKLIQIRGFPLLLGVLVIGVLLLILPLSSSKAEAKPTENGGKYDTAFFSAYEAELAHKIEQMAEALTGDKNASVLLTMDVTEETVYAKDSTVSGEKQYSTKYLLSNGTPVATYTVSPKVRGIAVVCRGADDASVRLALISMLTAAFDIPASRVYVGASFANMPDFNGQR